MKFKFDIKINEEDFYKFNEFVILRSPYGKKSMRALRLAIVIMLGLFSAMSFVMNGVTKGTLIALGATAVLILIFQIALNPVMKRTLRKQIKNMNSMGKPGYCESSVMEVYDDHFIDNQDDGEHKVRFASVERVSIIKDKFVYIHVNSATGYIIKRDVFESDEQYSEFEAFLAEKCKEINRYKK